jgi:NitT/TauT family transport system permease protein
MKRTGIVKIAIAAVFLLLWEAICRAKLVSPIILAAPSDIVAALASSGEEFLFAFQITAASILIATIMAWIVGIGFGLAIGLSPLGYGIFSPLLISFFAIPLITFYPLFIVWFGIGPASKIAFAVMTGSVPIALNTMDGVRMINPGFVLLTRSMGASAAQSYLRVYLPLALPAVLSGLRIGTSLVVIGVIVCEMLASVDGIGFWISYNRTLFKTGHVYLGIALAMSLVVVVNFSLGQIERRFALADSESRGASVGG